jgi:hypothetical protein
VENSKRIASTALIAVLRSIRYQSPHYYFIENQCINQQSKVVIHSITAVLAFLRLQKVATSDANQTVQGGGFFRIVYIIPQKYCSCN